MKSVLLDWLAYLFIVAAVLVFGAIVVFVASATVMGMWRASAQEWVLFSILMTIVISVGVAFHWAEKRLRKR